MEVRGGGLAGFYYQGLYVPMDRRKAVELWTKAAGKGSLVSMQNLAQIYFAGDPDTPRDMAAFARWTAEAAKLGDAQARFNLGLCYEKGDGVERNMQAALECYKLAAEGGLAEAKAKLEKLSASTEQKP